MDSIPAAVAVASHAAPETGADFSSVAGWERLVGRRHGGALLLLGIALAITTGTRVVLLVLARSDLSWDRTLAAAFAWGALFDAAALLLLLSPLALLLAVLPRGFFERRISRGVARAGFFVAVFGLLFLALTEGFFWAEFGARFNFIAVDYLIYTTEVIGNIRESYPLPALLGGVCLVAAGITFACARCLRVWFAHSAEPAGMRWGVGVAWLYVAAMGAIVLNESQLPGFANNYHRELAKNGVWSFFAAFRANQLDFEQFYPTIPLDVAFRRVRESVGGATQPLGHDGRDLLREVTNPGPELRLNVIQITVESLSASFLGHFGNTDRITPNLDALIPQALVFDQFYATGNRTDRGMEALTLSVPPTPGRSLVKRPHNEHLFTLGSVLRSRGYDTVFLYGGYGYFDNMNYFFGANGYRVVDRTAVPAEDVTFANVWGACDADLYRWTLREADAADAAGRPFFHFVMTTSNHRPYTFPSGVIDLPSKTSGRKGAVKYTDHEIGGFLAAAAHRPWFRNTVFVIVADHCASSAGRAELPVERYHIPLIIYAPGGQIPAGRVATLCSQVDYAPTLLGLLHWTYASRFFGRDVLAPENAGLPGRALVANYQQLGLYVGDAPANLAVIAPVRQMTTFHFDPATRETVRVAPDDPLLAETIGYYEAASYLFKHRKQSEYPNPAP